VCKKRHTGQGQNIICSNDWCTNMSTGGECTRGAGGVSQNRYDESTAFGSEFEKTNRNSNFTQSAHVF
jgi:hypothetical protein